MSLKLPRILISSLPIINMKFLVLNYLLPTIINSVKTHHKVRFKTRDYRNLVESEAIADHYSLRG